MDVLALSVELPVSSTGLDVIPLGQSLGVAALLLTLRG